MAMRATAICKDQVARLPSAESKAGYELSYIKYKAISNFASL